MRFTPASCWRGALAEVVHCLLKRWRITRGEDLRPSASPERQLDINAWDPRKLRHLIARSGAVERAPRPKSATSQRSSSATEGRRLRPQSAAASMDAGPSLVDVLTVMSDRVEAAKVLARLDAPEVAESMHARLFREIAQREAEMEKLQSLDKKIHNELQNLDENINKMRDFVDGSRAARKAALATVGQMSYAHVPTATKSKFADWKQFSAAKR